MVNHKLFRKDTAKDASIGEYLQQAIDIEISTIPTYLYTYYSINRTPTQELLCAQIINQLMSNNEKQLINGTPVLTLQEATKKAQDLSAQIMVLANKAGAMIMSVAIEEMLHVSLSSNIMQALVGNPILNGRTPMVWPAELPGHEPKLMLNKTKLSPDQLEAFIAVESPKPLGKKNIKTAIPYYTIGEFYHEILRILEKDFKKDSDYNTTRPQLVPGKGYYSANTIDTVYYNREHNPSVVSREDSGDIIHVTNFDSAKKAIQEICEQGEGNEADQHKTDDKSRQELSHWEKFKLLHKSLTEHITIFENEGLDLLSYFVLNVPTNPKTSEYPAHIQAVSNLVNGVYTYIFVMIEACYAPAVQNTQYEIFMMGIHKSMIFILNSLCGDINGMTYTDANGDQKIAAATFETYPFGGPSSPKSQLIALYNTAVAVYPKISYLGGRINDLPSVPLNNYNK